MLRYVIVKTEVMTLKEHDAGDFVRLSDMSWDKGGLCKTCSRSNICNPHRNYGVVAMACLKYKKRKGK